MQQDSSNVQHCSVPYAPFHGEEPSPMGYNPVMVVQERIQYPNYNNKVIKGLSLILIALGCLCILLQIYNLVMGDLIAVIGSGIWAGLIVSIVVTGYGNFIYSLFRIDLNNTKFLLLLSFHKITCSL